MTFRVSNDQLDELLEYLTDHPALAKGVGLGVRSKEAIDKQWETLASKLNSFGSGSTKSGARWKKYWADLKHKTKTRLARTRRDARATGGGPSSQGLSEIDLKILKIIGTEAVYGDTEHRVPFTTDGSDDAPESTKVVSSDLRTSPEPQETHSSQTPYTRKESPVTRPAPRRMQQRRCMRTSVQSNVSFEWVKELEARRVEAESKLADAALVMAEACRSQVEVARSQAEASRSQAETMQQLLTLIRDQNNDIRALVQLAQEQAHALRK